MPWGAALAVAVPPSFAMVLAINLVGVGLRDATAPENRNYPGRTGPDSGPTCAAMFGGGALA
jgi:hypothetical protein